LVHFHVCCGHDEGLTLGFVRAMTLGFARSLDLIGVEAPERM
jgi:hypothetical protein